MRSADFCWFFVFFFSKTMCEPDKDVIIIKKSATMTEKVDSTSEEDRKFKLKAGIFLGGVTGISALFGFGATLAAAKKKDPNYFDKGIVGSRGMRETGASLALRALGWGTVYAFTGCGILFYTIWKLLDVRDLHEFRLKMGSLLPRIPRNDPPQGRTEFENLTDLLQYLSSSDKERKGSTPGND